MSIDIFEALYLAAKDYVSPKTGDRGAAALAVDLGESSGGTFTNRLNPHQEGHAVRVKDLVRVMTATGDVRIPQAVSYLAGGVHVPLANGPYSDEALLDLWAEKMREDGDFAGALQNMLRTTPTLRAYEQVEREAMESVSALLAVVHRLRSLVR